jgi:hypothetical protein
MFVISGSTTTVTYKEFDTIDTCNVVKEATYEMVKLADGRVIGNCVPLNQ